MSSAAFVSVLMPVYNPGRFLDEAVASVLAQRYPAFELVAIDDASSDGSYERLCAFAARDPRACACFDAQPRNQGIVAARNRAFLRGQPQSLHTSRSWTATTWRCPTGSRSGVAFLESHFPITHWSADTRASSTRSRSPSGIRRYPTDYAEICAAITRYNPIAQPAVMLRRSLLPAAEPYSEAFPRCQDYELWLRLASQHPIANLDAPVINYRVSPQQGKRTQLRQTLALTLQLQRRWLFHPRFRRMSNVVYVGLEHLLMCVPEAAVLALFKRVTYARE